MRLLEIRKITFRLLLESRPYVLRYAELFLLKRFSTFQGQEMGTALEKSLKV